MNFGLLLLIACWLEVCFIATRESVEGMWHEAVLRRNTGTKEAEMKGK